MTQVALHGTERDVRTHRDNAKLHDRADAIFLVVHHLTDTRALIGRQGGQQATGQVTRQVLYKVNLFVDIQRLQRIEDVPVAHLVDQVIPDVFRSFKQYLPALVILHQTPQGVTLFGGKCFERIRQIRRGK